MLTINVDFGSLLGIEGLEDAAKAAMNDAARELTRMTHAYIIKQAHEKLHTRTQTYIDAMSIHQENDDCWVINLDAKARWIEDGMPRHNMIEDLLKSDKAKTSADGGKYVVVPFQHNKGPTQLTPAQANLLDTVKGELNKINKGREKMGASAIPYGSLETGADGKPKTGLLHSFDITKAPIKMANGPGTGKGPVGQVMQGPTGIPLLKGVKIYQREVEDKKTKEKSVKRFIMTFRVASSKQLAEGGRWDHPGLPPVNLMEKGMQWAAETWDKEIADKVVATFIAKLG